MRVEGEVLDWREREGALSSARELGAALGRRGFDLERGPLVRALLVRTGEREWYFYFGTHHIAADGWSLDVLASDWVRLYRGRIAEGSGFGLEELPVRYRDYAEWEAGMREEGDSASYWRQELSGLPGTTQWPRERVMGESGGGTVTGWVSRGEGLRRWCREREVTPFMVLQTVVQVLLYRYTGEGEVVTGFPVWGREREELKGQVGNYINLVPLRMEVRGEEAVGELLGRTKEKLLEVYGHQGYGFDRMVEQGWLGGRKGDLRVLVVYNERDRGWEVAESLPGVRVEPEEISSGSSIAEVVLSFFGSEEGCRLRIDYGSGYGRERMERVVGHIGELLEEVMGSYELTGKDSCISGLNYLTEGERERWGAGRWGVEEPVTEGLLEMFGRQVAEGGDREALIAGGERWSYRELDRRSEELSRELREEYGVREGELVGLQVERSAWLVIGIIAIWKAGAGYIPLDGELPADRLAYMMSDGGVRVVVREGGEVEMRDIRGDIKERTRDEAKIGGRAVYVMYTSGSTGRPKGVVIGERSVVNLLQSMRREPGMGPGDTVLAVTTFSFDISVLEIIAPLISGARLVLAGRREVYDVGD